MIFHFEVAQTACALNLVTRELGDSGKKADIDCDHKFKKKTETHAWKRSGEKAQCIHPFSIDPASMRQDTKHQNALWVRNFSISSKRGKNSLSYEWPQYKKNLCNANILVIHLYRTTSCHSTLAFNLYNTTSCRHTEFDWG